MDTTRELSPSKRARTAQQPAGAHGLHPWGAAIVKLFCRSCKPDYTSPWKSHKTSSSFSTAFVYSARKRLLLTNRHCVSHCVNLEARRRGDHHKFEARIVARGVDCDLALLTVDEPLFWEGSMSTAEIRLCPTPPELFADVMCVGYPTGGDTQCVTKGVVSRVDSEDIQDVWHRRQVVQIDAAINPGNSGGPAIGTDGTCVGVAYETLSGTDTENIGYIVPADVVRKFIAAWERNVSANVHRGEDHGSLEVATVRAFGHGGFDTQPIENEALRAHLSLPKDVSGVLITRVAPGVEDKGSAEDLRPGDVLVRFGGCDLGDDGSILLGDAPDRVPFPFAVASKFIGEKIPAVVWRGGKGKNCSLLLHEDMPVIPWQKEGEHLLNYVIFGGLVFVVLSRQYLRAAFGSSWGSSRCEGLAGLEETARWESTPLKRRYIVVLAEVLPDTANVGYHDMKNCRLLSVDTGAGAEMIRDLNHLAQTLDSGTAPLCVFTFQPKKECAHVTAVLDRALVQGSESRILSRARVPAARHLSDPR